MVDRPRLKQQRDPKTTLPVVFAGALVLLLLGMGAFVMRHVVLRFGTGGAIPYHEGVRVDYTKETTYFYPNILLLKLNAPVTEKIDDLFDVALEYGAKPDGYSLLDTEASECRLLFSKDQTEFRLKRIAEKLESLDYIESAELMYFTISEADADALPDRS